MNPNILFAFMDNLSYGEVGCYGGGLLRGAATPNIDSLARDGTKPESVCVTNVEGSVIGELLRTVLCRR